MIVMNEEINPTNRTLYVFDLVNSIKSLWRKHEEYEIKLEEKEKKNRKPEGGCIVY